MTEPPERDPPAALVACGYTLRQTLCAANSVTAAAKTCMQAAA
jgi:hypothetical protein